MLLSARDVQVLLAGVIDRDDRDNGHLLTPRALIAGIWDHRIVRLTVRCDFERSVDIAAVVCQSPYLALRVDFQGAEDYCISGSASVDVSLRGLLAAVDKHCTRGQADVEMPPLSL